VTAVTRYKPGDTFASTWQLFDPVTGTLGPPCGAEIRMHGYFWCPQICPQCLASYFKGYGADDSIYPSQGWFDADAARRVKANIDRNNGQYIPEFE
jgi:hypothetical protein